MKYKYNGQWYDVVAKSFDTIPIGAEMGWYGPANKVPNGWLICNGQQVSRTVYAELFSIIGTTYNLPGDTDNTLFRLPNKTGRTGVGVDPMANEFYAPGATYGEKRHTLTVAETPSHSHDKGTMDITGTFGITTRYSAADMASRTSGAFSFTNQGIPAMYTTGNDVGGYVSLNAKNSWTGNTSSVGSDGAHNNIQPSIAEYYIIKAFKTVVTPTGELEDTLPIGSVIDYDGNTVPDGYVQVPDYTIPAATQSTLGGVKIYVSNGNLYINTE